MGHAHNRSIVLLLFLQKQNLANAIYLFGLGTLLSGLGLKHMRTLSPEEWPKSAPFFFSATLLVGLNPSFFGVCKWNFPSRMKSIVFIFSATQSDCCKKQPAHERRTSV